MAALTRREREPGKGAVPWAGGLSACLVLHLGSQESSGCIGGPAHLPREGNPRELGARELPYRVPLCLIVFSAHQLETVRAAWHV